MPRTRLSRSMISSSGKRRMRVRRGHRSIECFGGEIAQREQLSLARGRPREASRPGPQAVVPAADAGRQIKPVNAPGWPWPHWHAVAGSRMASSSASKGECVLFTRSANGPTRSISAPSLASAARQMFKRQRNVVANRAKAVVHQLHSKLITFGTKNVPQMQTDGGAAFSFTVTLPSIFGAFAA